MKIVSMLITSMIISLSASAQTNQQAEANGTVAKAQQKTTTQKAKSSRKKTAGAKNSSVTTLSSEKAYKAKWTFEQMLMRRMEIDAEEGERKKEQQEV